jgi:intracellular sulfur oxidation DsrE/DsrF family protein
VTIAHADEGSSRGVEGWRAAVGLLRGLEGHQVQVLLSKAGARWALPEQQRKSEHVRQMVGHLLAAGVKPCVDSSALKELQLEQAELDTNVKIVDAEAIAQMVAAAEAQLTY